MPLPHSARLLCAHVRCAYREGVHTWQVRGREVHAWSDAFAVLWPVWLLLYRTPAVHYRPPAKPVLATWLGPSHRRAGRRTVCLTAAKRHKGTTHAKVAKVAEPVTLP